MRQLFFLLPLVLSIQILSTCVSGKPKDPLSVITEYQEALHEDDMERMLAVLAEDYVEINGQGTFRGKEAIRVLYEEEFVKNQMDCGNNQISGNTVTYECIYRISSAVIGGERYEAVIEDGKIVSNTVTGRFNP